MTSLSDGDYYKRDQYKEDRGAYLMNKYKCSEKTDQEFCYEERREA